MNHDTHTSYTVNFYTTSFSLKCKSGRILGTSCAERAVSRKDGNATKIESEEEKYLLPNNLRHSRLANESTRNSQIILYYNRAGKIVNKYSFHDYVVDLLLQLRNPQSVAHTIVPRRVPSASYGGATSPRRPG